MNVLILGNSHVAALNFAHTSYRTKDAVAMNCAFVPFVVPFMADLVLHDREQVILNPAIEYAIYGREKAMGSIDGYVMLIGGNEHTILGLMQHPRLYDFVVPGHEHLPLDSEAEIVPHAAIKGMLENSIHKSVCFFELFKSRVGDAPLVQLESPPPCPDADYILQNGGDYFRRRSGFAGVADSLIRLKLWLVACGIYRAECDRLGIEYVSVPPETVDSDGYLVREGWRDAVHGSEWFGGRYLRRIQSLLESRTSRPA